MILPSKLRNAAILTLPKFNPYKTWKWHPGSSEILFWKPSFLGFMLNLGSATQLNSKSFPTCFHEISTPQFFVAIDARVEPLVPPLLPFFPLKLNFEITPEKLAKPPKKRKEIIYRLPLPSIFSRVFFWAKKKLQGCIWGDIFFGVSTCYIPTA